MTATDKLRRLLDERGVKWTRSCYSGMRYLENTMWPIVSSNPIKFTEYSDGQTKLIIENATPEQAIAATLGRGTCEYCKDGKFDGQSVMMSNHGWQRINYCPNCGRRVKGGAR